MQISNRVVNLGTESAFEVLVKAEDLKKQGADIINLGIGQPDFLTSEHIVEAAVKALRDGEHGYTPPSGLKVLREAVCEKYFRKYQISVDPNNVLITPGGKPVIFFVVCIFGGDDVEILYPNPGFPIYESIINYSGAKAIPYPLMETDNFSIDADTILNKVTTKTRLLILNSPHNPTGAVSDEKEIKKLVKGLTKFPDIAILSDEIYSKIYFDNLTHFSLIECPEIKDRLIILDGWSKTYAMTGWRLGYSIWPQELIQPATKLAINTYSCVSGFTQLAGISALKESQNAVEKMVQAFEERRDVLVNGLNAIKNIDCRIPKGAFYAFPNIKKTGKSSKLLQNELLERAGVALLSGSSFGSFGEGYLRISFANSLKNIETAIERIGNYLED